MWPSYCTYYAIEGGRGDFVVDIFVTLKLFTVDSDHRSYTCIYYAHAFKIFVVFNFNICTK